MVGRRGSSGRRIWACSDVALAEPIRLTSLSHGAGCACKLGPSQLHDVLELLGPSVPTEDVIVSESSGDDAAVYRLPDGRGAIVTLDFFTPLVDDPYDWGRIAAANALSDVYAMGGVPALALNLLCWPRDVLPFSVAAEVLRGGLDVATMAGCHVAGGHSVDDPEPKYGMAVTGLVDAMALMRNDAGRAGEPLTLTKPLGI